MSPATVVLEQLASARRAGATFDTACPDALASALLAADADERREWAAALAGTADAWRCSWERRPARPPERALLLVADRELGEPLPERVCAHCGEEIPGNRGRRGGPAKYCSDQCRRDMFNQRVRSLHKAISLPAVDEPARRPPCTCRCSRRAPRAAPHIPRRSDRT